MSKRLPLGPGKWLELDQGPRQSVCHRKILRVEDIPGVRIAKLLVLDCGHCMALIGDPALMGGRALCQHCLLASN